MKKVIVLITMLFLVGCSPKEVKIGMTPEEVHDILGEPYAILNDTTVDLIVGLSLDNHWYANKDETHRLNNDEAFKTDVSYVVGKLEHLQNKIENGTYVESYYYEIDDEGGVHYYFIDNELFLIDDVSRYMLQQKGK